MTPEIINHLWQSTLFAAAVGLLTIAFRRNRAAVRYALWLSASVKFLVPFALLQGLGHWLRPASRGAILVPDTVSAAVVIITEPFSSTAISQPATPPMHWLLASLLTFWFVGLFTLAVVRFSAWRRIRAAIRASMPASFTSEVEIRTSLAGFEPGVVGWLRPIILLPAGIEKRLTPEQLDAVITHEVCHVRRRDNLTAGIQMIAESIFWFHPLVWWIGTRMLEERERACDEAVLRLGSEPALYAESLLAVCRWYAEAPLICLSGMAGANIRSRIESIFDGRSRRSLNGSRKLLLAAAGLAAIGGPVGLGILDIPLPLDAQSAQAFEQQAEHLTFEVASIKENKTGGAPHSNFPLNAGSMYTANGGRLSATGFPLVTYIAFAYNLLGNQLQYLLPQLPGWASTERFDIEARAKGNPTKDQMRLMMRSLLADRFKFAIHSEAREVPVLAMELAKKGKFGPQLQVHPADADCPTMTQPAAPNQVPAELLQKVPGGYPAICGTILGLPPTAPGRSRLGGRKVTLQFMADMFSQRVDPGGPMIDGTGLAGMFDFLIEFVPDSKPASPGGTSAPTASGPTFQEALLDQLGLKLESRKSSIPVIVVDHVERPSEN